jgi:hypothetical protein
MFRKSILLALSTLLPSLAKLSPPSWIDYTFLLEKGLDSVINVPGIVVFLLAEDIISQLTQFAQKYRKLKERTFIKVKRNVSDVLVQHAKKAIEYLDVELI